VSSFSRSSFRSIEVVTGPALAPAIGFTILAVFVQTMFAPRLTFHGAVPSFATIAVVLYAAKVGARRGAVLGLVAGVLEDSFAGTGGAWTIAMTITALAVGGISRTFFSDGFAMLGALVALAILGRDALFWAVMRMEGYPPGFGVAHLHAALWQAGTTALCAMLYLVVRARFVNDRTAVERYP
jgi:rod shape-determining protein MreD